jgi:PH (Pleckstrin Homology) domain-containing protein
METVFRSKVDLWLVVVIVAVPIMLLDYILDGLNIPDKFAELSALTIVIAVLGLLSWLYFSTRYTISGDFLLVKAGPFAWVIPIEDIVSVEPTRNPSSGPALSLDRLLIRYGHSAELIISPKDKFGFMKELKKHLNPRSTAVNL